jgi:uncharacterized lipoprotein YmbA
VKQVFTAFGRLVRPDGRAVADAELVSPRGIGHSDENGYFQIEVSTSENGWDANVGARVLFKLCNLMVASNPA